jgi:lipopolysaccharide/colanic/teichoic acid biosynthesis glycosyltransferase
MKVATMRLNTLRSWWRQRGIDSDAPLLEKLHSVQRFQTILQVERQRVDRAGGSITLLVFRFEPEQANEFRLFAQLLQRRVRATDHAGLMGERQVGVILWNASPAGPRQFIESLSDPDYKWTCPAFDAYTYPAAEGGHPKVSDQERCLPERSGSDASDRESPEHWAPLSDETPPLVEQHAMSRALPLTLLLIEPIPLWKRSIDVIAATLGVVVLAPLLAATALAIKCTSRGPILFLQQRSGLGGRPFVIYKFRTMCIDAEAQKARLRAQSEQDGPAFKMTYDPRVTWVGRFLRKSCIDELPQLWNILRGDMTLVGPRPLPCDEQAGCTPWQNRRLEVTPGLTCIWQIRGKSKVSFAEWMRMDIRYIQARTLARDLHLIAETIWAVLLHRGSC